MADLASQRVLLTGGSSGVGFEAAKVLSAQGHQLTIVCRNQAMADQTRSLLPGSVHTLICDLADLCLLYTSPSPRDKRQSRMPSSA